MAPVEDSNDPRLYTHANTVDVEYRDYYPP